jgi:hypothetical protein
MKLLCTLALASLAVLASSCKQPVSCPSLGDCGGPLPTGYQQGTDSNWVLAPGHPSCTEDLYVPPNDPRLTMGNIVTAGTPYPEPALYDWCVLLVTGPGVGDAIQVKPPRFFYESGPIGFATVKFQADGHFSTGISRIGTFILYFPEFCIHAFGAKDGMIDPNTNMPYPNVCKQLEPPLKSSGIGEGSYQNTVCVPNNDENRAPLEAMGVRLDVPADPGGCLCRFDVDETGGPAGTFARLDDNTIIDYPDAVGSNYYQKTTYCLQGDNLKLTGADGAYLFDQKGLRTMDLVRTCTQSTECASGHCNIQPMADQGLCQ